MSILHNVLVVEVLGFFKQLVVFCKVMNIPNGHPHKSSHWLKDLAVFVEQMQALLF